MIKKLIFKKQSLYFLLVSVFLLITLNPYYVWGFFKEAYVAVLLVLLSLSVFFKSVFSVKKALLSVPVFFLVFAYFMLNEASFSGSFAFALGVVFIFSIDNKYLLSVFSGFKIIYSIVLLPGLVLWVLHYFIGNDFLYLGQIADEINPNQLKAEAGQGYALYPFTVVLDYMLNLPVYRFMGPFDEPGRVGTVSAIILAVNNFKFKSKSDYVVLLSGLASFSLAFYMLLFIYLAVVSSLSYKYFLTVFCFILFVLVAANFNETVSRYTVDRISISDGKLSGDNRSNTNLDNYYSAWLNGSTTQLLSGIPEYISDGSSSWKEVAVKTGLIGFSILLAVLLFGFFSVGVGGYNYILLAAFLLVFLASFYQRPEILNPLVMLLFLLGLIKSKRLLENRFLQDIK